MRALLVVLLAAAGCAVQDMPLPGGADLGERPREVTIEFADALDLVPQSLCKVDDVDVGKVTSIELVSWRAEVVCTVRGDVELPPATGAAIAQTSLLGEKYVRLEPAGRGPAATRIPLARTGQGAEVEQVLAAASLVVNGGGLERLGTITRELDQVLGVRTGRLRSLLRRLETFAAGLDRSKGDIVRLIGDLDRVAATLAARTGTIDAVATRIGPAVRQLRRGREDLTGLVRGLGELGRTAERVVRRSHDDTLANLRHLRALLAQLDRAKRDIARGLGTAITFPFPTAGMVRGDYGNVDVTLDLSPSTTLENLLGCGSNC